LDCALWLVKNKKKRVLAASKLDYFSSLYGVEMGNRRYDADDTPEVRTPVMFAFIKKTL